MTSSDHEPYDWQAFCYVCGELNDDEARRWERLLMEDERARLAMARMIQLTDALGVVFSDRCGAERVTVARPAAQPWKRRMQSVVAIAIAVCATVVAVGWWLLETHRASRPHVIDTQSLAEAWLDTYSSSPWAHDHDIGIELDDRHSVPELSVVEPNRADWGVAGSGSEGAPGWLLLAVAELNGQRPLGDREAEGQP